MMKNRDSNIHFHQSGQYHISFHPILSLDGLVELTNSILPNDPKDKAVLQLSADQLTFQHISDAGNLCVSVYHDHSFSGFVRNIIHSSAAKSSWLAANYLLENNFNTPEPLAYVEKYRYGMVSQSWYICRFEQGVAADEYFIGAQTYTPAMANTVSRIVDFIMDLKLTGISHGKLTASNLLLFENEIKVIDLSMMRFNLSNKLSENLWNKDVEHFMESWRERYDIYKYFHQAFVQRGVFK